MATTLKTAVNQNLKALVTTSIDTEIRYRGAFAELQKMTEAGWVEIVSTGDYEPAEFAPRYVKVTAKGIEYAVAQGWIEAPVVMKSGTVTLPVDMLWVDVNADGCDADATETAFADAAARKLYTIGYDMHVTYGSVVSIEVEFDEPALGDSGDAVEISAIISALDVDYIGFEAE